MTTKSIRHAKPKKKDTDPLRSAYHVLEEWIEINRRQIVIFAGAAAAIALVFGCLYYFFEYRHDKAVAAYSDAFAKYTATVGADADQPGAATPGLNKVTFPDEATKYNTAGAAFEKLADDYPSYRALAKYYAGVSYLHTDADKGVKLLEAEAAGSGDTRNEARLALAEHYASLGAFDKAEGYYKQLLDDPGSMPAQYLNLRYGWVEEKLGKTAEAAKLYRAAVDADRDSQAGTEAEKGLQRVDPKQAASLPPKGQSTPGSGPKPFTQQGGRPTRK